VDPSVVEVARGMGMTRRQILTRVELPLSLPFIMSGVRISTVWTIGIATLCGLVGAGGLGDLIMQGLRSNQLDYLIAGTVPAAILALLFDFLMGLVEKWLTPEGMKMEQEQQP
jgi:osmoprotectant transport system permease protein